ncbi:MAG: NAD(P)/FAD-dependent oxidoreductase [Chitinispirillaceae bacterium]
MNYDIIVVGAGPAGSMAAFSAAKEGKKVCLLERKPEAGVPVRCGEGIGFKGLTLSVDPRPEWLKCCIKRSVMVSPSGVKVEVGNVGQSWILDREKMDGDLVKDAQKAGAEYISSCPVISAEKRPDGQYVCRSLEKEFVAPCLIVADGVESRLARFFGWNTALKPLDLETCAFARVISPFIENDCCTFHVGSTAAPGGYVWVFPRAKGEANVGLGVIGSKSKPGLSKELLLNFIDKEFPGSRITHLHCGGVPVAKWVKPLVKEGVMLVGDAARQVNAMSGAGIAYSLFAGKLAGSVAAKATSNGKVDYKQLLEYEKGWAKHYGKQQLRSYSLKEFILSADDSFLDRIANSLAKEDPQKINYLRVFTRTFAGKPLLLLKAIKLFR